MAISNVRTAMLAVALASSTLVGCTTVFDGRAPRLTDQPLQDDTSTVQQEYAQVLNLDLPYDQMYPEQDPDTATFEVTDKDIDLVARIVWGESRKQPIAGQEWVVHVMVNRLLKGEWGGSIREVVTFKVGRYHAFSALNRFDPNYRKLMAVTEADEDFVLAKEIARKVLIGRSNHTLPDESRGALYYHADYVWPRWASKKNQVAKIGCHIFYFAAVVNNGKARKGRRYS